MASGADGCDGSLAVRTVLSADGAAAPSCDDDHFSVQD